MNIERFHNELAMRLGYERIVKNKRLNIAVEESDDPWVMLTIDGCDRIHFKASEELEDVESLKNLEMRDEIKQISAAVHEAYLRSTNNSLFVYNSLQR